jgi:hypothetical protein
MVSPEKECLLKRILWIFPAFVALGSVTLLVAANPPRAPDATATPAQRGVAKRVRLIGLLSTSQGKFFLNDVNTQVTYELRGKDLEKLQGSRVVVRGRLEPGSDSPSGALPIVVVASIQIAVAAAAGSGAAAAAVTTGISHAAVAAIVVGGAAAGTLGGLRAADVIGSSGQPASPP